jgi:hypothetical protein
MLFKNLGPISVAVLLVSSQLALASEMTIKVIQPAAGEKSAASAVEDDRVVAYLSYSAIETTQLCNGPVGNGSMKISVHADGSYYGEKTSSRIVCPGSGVQAKGQYSRSNGRLTLSALAKLKERLDQMTAEARELAGTSGGLANLPRDYVTTIKVAHDLRGVFDESDPSLKIVTQTGEQAKISAEFMQKFLKDGKID